MKSSVGRAVTGEKVIVNNSKDFFECAKKLNKEDVGHKEHFRRTIFHVAAMNHNRPERSNQCRTLKGTSKIQAIKAADQMIIQTRNLSCFCEGCINGDSQACVNRDYVFDWELQDIKKTERPVLTARNAGAERGRRRGNAQRGVRQREQGRGVRSIEDKEEVVCKEGTEEVTLKQGMQEVVLKEEEEEVKGKGDSAEVLGREDREEEKKGVGKEKSQTLNPVHLTLSQTLLYLTLKTM